VGTILNIGVTDSEKLAIVSSDYQVRFYSVHGELVNTFFWPQEVKDQGILEAQIWGSGMCVLTRKMQFCVVTNMDEPIATMYANTGLKEAPASWCVIDAHFTASGMAEILVSVGSGTIVVVDSERWTDMKLTNGPFTKMTVSPTGKMLAAFSPGGFVWVVSTDFSQNLCQFQAQPLFSLSTFLFSYSSLLLPC
jgi:vacuolar protein sorting-associated protein 16